MVAEADRTHPGARRVFENYAQLLVLTDGPIRHRRSPGQPHWERRPAVACSQRIRCVPTLSPAHVRTFDVGADTLAGGSGILGARVAQLQAGVTKLRWSISGNAPVLIAYYASFYRLILVPSGCTARATSSTPSAAPHYSSAAAADPSWPQRSPGTARTSPAADCGDVREPVRRRTFTHRDQPDPAARRVPRYRATTLNDRRRRRPDEEGRSVSLEQIRRVLPPRAREISTRGSCSARPRGSPRPSLASLNTLTRDKPRSDRKFEANHRRAPLVR